MNLPLTTSFTESYRFWVNVFSFSFISMHSLISFFISSVICWLFRSALFSFRIFLFLILFPPWLTSNLTALWSEKMFEMISIFFLIYQGKIYSPERDLSLRIICVHLRKWWNPLFWSAMPCRYQLCPTGLMYHLKLVFPWWFSVWMICPLMW